MRRPAVAVGTANMAEGVRRWTSTPTPFATTIKVAEQKGVKAVKKAESPPAERENTSRRRTASAGIAERPDIFQVIVGPQRRATKEERAQAKVPRRRKAKAKAKAEKDNKAKGKGKGGGKRIQGLETEEGAEPEGEDIGAFDLCAVASSSTPSVGVDDAGWLAVTLDSGAAASVRLRVRTLLSRRPRAR